MEINRRSDVEDNKSIWNINIPGAYYYAVLEDVPPPSVCQVRMIICFGYPGKIWASVEMEHMFFVDFSILVLYNTEEIEIKYIYYIK